MRHEVKSRAAADELETHYRQGGLKGVLGALQSHCRRLDLLTETTEKSKIIDAMATVADAVTKAVLDNIMIVRRHATRMKLVVASPNRGHSPTAFACHFVHAHGAHTIKVVLFAVDVLGAPPVGR